MSETKAEKYRRDYDATHHASTIKQLPTTTKYWALEEHTRTYDSGYGHSGSPDMVTDTSLSVVYFDTDEALEAWVLSAVEQRKSYKVFRVEPVNIEVKAVFSIQK